MAVYCKGPLGKFAPHAPEEWQTLQRLLDEIDLDATARQCKALLRRRGVSDAVGLLRTAVAYGVSGLSLRSTAAWAGMTGVAELCDVSLLNRLRKANEWLDLIWRSLLDRQLAAVPMPGLDLTVRLVDATCISSPRSKGTDYRLHLDYRPQQGRFGAAYLTDGRQAEGFHHFTAAPGELLVGDRIYGRASGIRHVLADGGHVLVRVGWKSTVLLDPEGNPFNLIMTLANLPTDRISTRSVQVAASAKNRTAICSARLILVPLPPDAAEKSRRKVSHKAKREGRTLRPESAVAASWMILLTTLEEERATPDQLVALYRLRWQIELAFKRLKSILHLDRLPAKDPALAKAWLAANLIVALLIDRLYPQFIEPMPANAIDRAPVWRTYALLTLRIVNVVLASHWNADVPHILRLVEPTRARKRQLPTLTALLS